MLGGAAPDAALFAGEPVQQVAVADEEEALAALKRHGYDMVVEPGPPRRYWINSSSAKGSVLERILGSSAAAARPPPVGSAARSPVASSATSSG